jgi:hypothetical protein
VHRSAGRAREGPETAFSVFANFQLDAHDDIVATEPEKR